MKTLSNEEVYSMRGHALALLFLFVGCVIFVYILLMVFFMGWGFFEHVQLIAPHPFYNPALIARWMLLALFVCSVVFLSRLYYEEITSKKKQGKQAVKDEVSKVGAADKTDA